MTSECLLCVLFSFVLLYCMFKLVKALKVCTGQNVLNSDCLRTSQKNISYLKLFSCSYRKSSNKEVCISYHPVCFSVPKPLVELHIKLLRKMGRSVSTDRWEKYLAKVRDMCMCDFIDAVNSIQIHCTFT